ncbi:uncharacterized protein RCO7_05691 [Rhynchosporium graminicola]|uniref:Fork-head domain-containing protein n=1 Tax=Rhynchosporium graminicola TaxID=2792576 RepID=A0A1E1KBU9_9HELO|nr:uncharacterized protein RCO7_05691 [Rhynchosporium commune]
MNSGSYNNHQPQISSLLADYQYDETLDHPTQATHPMFTSSDGLPQNPSHHILSSSSLSPSILPDSTFNLHQPMSISMPMSMSNSSMAWTDPYRSSRAYETQNSTNSNNHSDYYNYSPSNIAGNEHNGSLFRGYRHQQQYQRQQVGQIPRYSPNLCGSTIGNNGLPLEDSYEPSAYLLDSGRTTMDSSNSNMESPYDYQTMSNGRELESPSFSHSLFLKIEHDDTMSVMSFDRPPPFDMHSSRNSEEGNSSREMTAAELEEHNVEPYAKLIYRALMSAPNRSMVLQEIYQWFRENTHKGSSNTKGWMNSIRHNLSMNAAFKKTERKTTGDDTKKSTEWVLEEFAVRDGVQSTTRYRKGAVTKKFIKPGAPAPSRGSSGRKGGMSTKQVQAKVQHQQRHRSGGMSIKGEEQGDGDPTRSTHSIDNTRRSEYHQQARSQISQRQRSPLTPPSASTITSPTVAPYFYPKVEQFDMPYEDLYRFEDVSGVCIDNESPLFSNGADAHYQMGRNISNHHF